MDKIQPLLGTIAQFHYRLDQFAKELKFSADKQQELNRLVNVEYRQLFEPEQEPAFLENLKPASTISTDREYDDLVSSSTVEKRREKIMFTYRYLSEKFLRILLDLDSISVMKPGAEGSVDEAAVEQRRHRRKEAVVYVQRFLTNFDRLIKTLDTNS